MNASPHPAMLHTSTPSDLRRAVELAAEDIGLPLLIFPRAEDLFRRFADHYLSLRARPRRARRALKRRWARSVATLALLLALGQAPALQGGGLLSYDSITVSRKAPSPATSSTWRRYLASRRQPFPYRQHCLGQYRV